MIDMLKPARDIITELNRLESKWTKTLIHGIGKIQNVTCDRFHWRFCMKLNDGISINCSIINKEDGKNYIYFEEGDIIEFFGTVNTHWQGIFSRYNVSDICLYNAKLSCEERYYSDVFMWNIKTYKGDIAEKIAITRNEKGIIDSQIACISELEETESTENKWTYGHLIKKWKDVILQLDKVIE